MLTNEGRKKTYEILVKCGADFIETFTGFSTGETKVESVGFMKETTADEATVKASGDIHSGEEVLVMIKNDVDRIGASNGIEVVEE